MNCYRTARVLEGVPMSKVGIAALIALCAALFSAIGDARWWMGGAAAIANYSLQAAALAWGSVVMVTALQVTALLFALPIYARLTKRPVTRFEWVWAVVLAGALAALIIVGDPASGEQRASVATWAIVAAVVLPVLVVCVLAARIYSGRPFAA